MAFAGSESITPVPLKALAMKLTRSSRIPTIKLAKDAENQAYLDMLAVAKNGQPRLQKFPRSAFAIGDELSILYFPGEMFAD